MPQYLSPGVYVEEVPSAVKTIAGVGTSTAGFIGTVANAVQTPPQPGKLAYKLQIKAKADEQWNVLPPIIKDGNGIETFLDKDGRPVPIDDKEHLRERPEAYASLPPAVDAPVTFSAKVVDGPDKDKDVTLTYQVGADGKPAWTAKIEDQDGGKTCGEIEWILHLDEDGKPVAIHYPLAPAGEPQLVTSWAAFKNAFGDLQEGNKTLANAVYGFFNNGGTRCWVIRVTNLAEDTSVDQVKDALAKFETIDEIAIVAVPMPTDVGAGDADTNLARRVAIREMVLEHCENMQDRFAILDGEETVEGALVPKEIYSNAKGDAMGKKSDYGAVYFPWIDVSGTGVYVPPSGHIAGIYAQVDGERGVHKAPANVVIRGARGVKYRVSKSQQDGLNPDGINVIRQFDGNITVWGGRTIGGDANTEFKYINVRRLFNFLRESIDKGTQWVVFEPNTPALWAKITRNVTAFLTNVWAAGALFGDTPQQAFYVKCDEETNPPAVRDLGQVVTEVGVAVVKPAEFVIFRISQWAGPGGG